MNVGFRLCVVGSCVENAVAELNWGWLLGNGCWVEESLNRGWFLNGVLVAPGVEGPGVRLAGGCLDGVGSVYL